MSRGNLIPISEFNSVDGLPRSRSAAVFDVDFTPLELLPNFLIDHGFKKIGMQ